MTVYGYCRVSSKSQTDGFGLDVQRQSVINAGAVEIYEDVYTGTTMDRPKWDELMEIIGEGDTLVVAKLDRIARTAAGGASAVRDLIDRGVTVNVLNMGVLSDTPVGRMLVTVIFAMAEFERDLIVERLRDGKAMARQQEDYHEGRPRLEIDNFNEVASQVQSGSISAAEGARRTGVSYRTFRRRMEEYNAA